VREAELLISASPKVRTLAESGDLKTLHEKYNAIEKKYQADYLKVRDSIDRIL